MKPLPPESLAKAIFGIQQYGDLFIDHRYCKKDRSGTPWVDCHPPDFYFLASEDRRILHFGTDSNAWLTLYVKPNPTIVQPARNYCTAGSFQAFRLIPWPAYGHALVKATDVNMMADPWVAFVPLASIPEINPDNTATGFDAEEWPIYAKA